MQGCRSVGVVGVGAVQHEHALAHLDPMRSVGPQSRQISRERKAAEHWVTCEYPVRKMLTQADLTIVSEPRLDAGKVMLKYAPPYPSCLGMPAGCGRIYRTVSRQPLGMADISQIHTLLYQFG